jgi:PLD-like domain
MKLTLHAIRNLKELVSGDTGLTQRMSGQNLVDFFNDFGEKDSYVYPSVGIVNEDIKDGRSPSRNEYVVKKLQKYSGSKRLKDVLERVINQNAINSKEVAEKVNQIIKSEGYRVEENNGVYSVITHDVYAEPVEKEVHFEQIQAQILAELDKAKFTIWVAVAWFTDKVLFDKLVEKKKAGLNIQLLVSDDDINRQYGFDYEKEFETRRIPKSSFDNLMHHKFCVIDNETVINGSYNWTNKARYNKENITIDKDRAMAKTFAENFIKVKTGK